MHKAKQVKPVCPVCGSDNVHATNTVHFPWDVEAQDWDWSNNIGGEHYQRCDACDETVIVKFVPIKESEEVLS